MEVVIIGAGASGLLHTLAFRACGANIAAVYDPDAERARSLAEMSGARVACSFEEVLECEAGAAAVCSPPALHVAQAEALADGGRLVFVEKPVATSIEALERLRALARCVPIVQWRAGRALRALRRAIAHGELGDAPVLSCDLAWSRDESYFRSREEGWGCGALLSVGVHAVDAVRFAVGAPIEAVSGLRGACVQGGGETAAVAILRFAGGAVASLRISFEGAVETTRITACGRGVTVVLEGAEGDPTATALRWSARDAATKRRLEALERDTPGALGPPLLVPYLAGAVDALRRGLRPGDAPQLLSIADVAEAHAAILTIYRASDEGPRSMRS